MISQAQCVWATGLLTAALCVGCGGGSSGGAALGAPCADPTAGQSTCASGLSCAAISAQNMCTIQCTTDSDCPSSSTCWGNLCWPTCTPGADAGTADGGASDGGVCGRSDFLCFSNYAASPLCAPDCTQEVASFCASQLYGYPYIECDGTDGALHGACISAGPDCEASATACSSSEVCYPISNSSPADSTCVADCTLAPATSCSADSDCVTGNCVSNACQACPPAFSCSTTTNACEPIELQTYLACVATSECPSGETCSVLVSPANAECVSTCSSATVCPAAPSNTTAVPSCDTVDGVCGLDCSQMGATCPAGQTCEPVTDSAGDPMMWCLPT